MADIVISLIVRLIFIAIYLGIVCWAVYRIESRINGLEWLLDKRFKRLQKQIEELRAQLRRNNADEE